MTKLHKQKKTRIIFFIPVTIDRFFYAHTYNIALSLSEMDSSLEVQFYGIPVNDMTKSYGQIFKPLKDFSGKYYDRLKYYASPKKRGPILIIKLLVTHFYFILSFTFNIQSFKVVYLRSGHLFFTLYVLIAKVFGKKIVIESNELPMFKNSFSSNIYKWIIKKADLILVQGVELNEVTSAYIGCKNKVINIENGVDTKLFCYTAPPIIESGVPLSFLSVGSLGQVHSLDEMFEAVNTILDIRLDIIGVGRNQSIVERMACDNSRIKYLGYVSHHLVPQKISQAHCCFAVFNKKLPKHQKHGFCFSSLKIFEYLAAGRPVFVNVRNTFIDSIIEEGVAFYFETTGDIQRVIDQFRDNNKYYNDVCSKARVVAEGYDWKKRLNELSLYINRM